MAVNGGVKNWASGQVLDAADLNKYVADQTIARFATIAARTAAYGVSGAPALQAGMFSWVESTEKLYYYDGTSWEEVGAQVEDGEITEAKLASGAVTEAKLADSAVTSAKLADSAVTSAKIADGTIVNADVNASAAIAHSKLASITAGQVLVGNSSNVPTATALSGDVTVNSTGVTAIASGVIVNADVSTSAAIAHSKLANATSGQVLLGTTTTGVVTATTVTGDVTITGAGVTGITAGSIVNADINSSAAIAYSKLNLSSSITSSDIADGTIVNGDISSTAAIDRGKIADLSIDTKTSNYSLVLGDKNKVIEMNVGSANTVTVPLNSSHAFPIGSQVTITQYGTGKTTVAGAVGVSIVGTPGVYLRTQYSSATLIKRATDEWYLVGDLSAT